jgi:Cysteine-rich CPXCG
LSMNYREEDLEQEFPLGDGTADVAALVCCPYCGESVEIALDPGSGAQQEYTEDCQVCCRPWRVSVGYRPDGSAVVMVDTEDVG